MTGASHSRRESERGKSHFAGGIVLNAADGSARFSYDFDIFHELAAEVTRASNRDVESLRRAGFQVETPSRHGEWEKDATFRKARVSRGTETVEIDWAADSAFRFFPIERDPLLGWRLHLFDIATNKALTLSARTETRDYVDIVELHRTFPLPAICWAACGKDPGFSPLSLLKMMRRFAKIDPAKLEEIQARALDPVKLKMAWIGMSDAAEAEMIRVANERPDLPIGVDRRGVCGRRRKAGLDWQRPHAAPARAVRTRLLADDAWIGPIARNRGEGFVGVEVTRLKLSPPRTTRNT